VAVDPLLRPHADYYSGVAFQVHLVQPETGASSLLAVGAHISPVLPPPPGHQRPAALRRIF
jgi:hypothetical protein